MGRVHKDYDVFLRCRCGREAMLGMDEYPLFPRLCRFRCTACGADDPEIAVWPGWQRALRRADWSPWTRISHGRPPR